MDRSLLRLFGWIHLNRKKLKVRVLNRKWNHFYSSELQDVAVHGKFLTTRRASTGLGSGSTYIEAYTKAIAELMEREMLQVNRIHNSNGCAVHGTREQAELQAKLELIERDSFLCHFLTGTPMQKMRVDRARILGLPFPELQKKMHNRGIKITYYRMRTAVDVYAVSAVIETISGRNIKGFLFALGHGCSPNKAQALNHATVEAMRTLDWMLFHRNSRRRPLSEKTFWTTYRRRKFAKVEDHARLWLDKDYVQKIKQTLFRKAKVRPEIGRPFLTLNQIHAKHFKNKGPFKNAPLVLCQATSEHLQKLYFGPTFDQRLNRPRLRKFLNLKSHQSFEPTSFPHPIA